MKTEFAVEINEKGEPKRFTFFAVENEFANHFTVLLPTNVAEKVPYTGAMSHTMSVNHPKKILVGDTCP